MSPSRQTTAGSSALTIDMMKVLVVEDSFESLTLIKKMLQDLGITQIYTARNGIEALSLLGTFDGEDFLSVVLCDWNMPRMSGMELLRQIRTCDPDLLFLMITGNADLSSVVEAKANNVTAYIRKPFSLDELRRKLNLVLRVLNHRRAAR